MLRVIGWVLLALAYVGIGYTFPETEAVRYGCWVCAVVWGGFAADRWDAARAARS